MRHARPEDLDRLDPLLADLRSMPGMIEKSRGVFYRRGKAFLHFHEDPKGLFADLRNAEGDFDRLDVTAEAAWPRLVEMARSRL